MKKFRTIVLNAQTGPLGVLTLALIFIVIHALAFLFKEYGVLPLFYTIVFIAIVVNIYQEWMRNKHN